MDTYYYISIPFTVYVFFFIAKAQSYCIIFNLPRSMVVIYGKLFFISTFHKWLIARSMCVKNGFSIERNWFITLWLSNWSYNRFTELKLKKWMNKMETQSWFQNQMSSVTFGSIINFKFWPNWCKKKKANTQTGLPYSPPHNIFSNNKK